MKILVTGATGFAVSAIADKLRRRGHDTVGPARSKSAATVRPICSADAERWVRVDQIEGGGTHVLEDTGEHGPRWWCRSMPLQCLIQPSFDDSAGHAPAQPQF